MKNLTVIACAALLAAWAALAARPQFTGLQDAQGLRDQAQQTLSRDTELAATLPGEQRRAAQLALRSEQLAATLPAREDLSALLRDLRVMADARKVTLSAVARNVIPGKVPGISAITLNLSGAGRYPDMQRFLDDLHGTSRAITTDSGSFTVSQGALNTTLKLITYARNLPVPKQVTAEQSGSPLQPTGTLQSQSTQSQGTQTQNMPSTPGDTGAASPVTVTPVTVTPINAAPATLTPTTSTPAPGGS